MRRDQFQRQLQRRTAAASRSHSAAWQGPDERDPMLGFLASTAAARNVSGEPLRQAFDHAQHTAGNAAVQRAVINVQRWAVKVPATATCDQLIRHTTTRSPYRPEAAKTKAKFKYKPSYSVEGDPGSFTATISSANVTAAISVDMPTWNPTGAMKQPWASAWRALRDHEGEHEKVAESIKDEMTSTLEAISATAAKKDSAKAAASKQAATAWKALLRKHARDQAALDPYNVDINCP